MSETDLKLYTALVQLSLNLQLITRHFHDLSSVTTNQTILRDQSAYLIDSVKAEIIEMECEQLQKLTDELK